VWKPARALALLDAGLAGGFEVILRFDAVRGELVFNELMGRELSGANGVPDCQILHSLSMIICCSHAKFPHFNTLKQNSVQL